MKNKQKQAEHLQYNLTTNFYFLKGKKGIGIDTARWRIWLTMPGVVANAGLTAQVDQMKKTNEQLKRELNIKRAKFSDSAKE